MASVPVASGDFYPEVDHPFRRLSKPTCPGYHRPVHPSIEQKPQSSRPAGPLTAVWFALLIGGALALIASALVPKVELSVGSATLGVFLIVAGILVRRTSRNAPTDGSTSGTASLTTPVLVGHTATGEPVYANPASTSTNTMAILALCFGVMGGILGIVFGHIALSQIKRTGEQGRGMAIAGLVLGYIALAATIAWFIFLAVFLNSIHSY
ncbi:DUF4190 domain-containing protein [Tsukamurella sp. NPDC003166]|uniref:DUF4190 domain-containing protein n=1 Tax=Tsukamurella sp. NPDC003166 TaxID=3154444 RepID=UPI00339FA16A